MDNAGQRQAGWLSEFRVWDPARTAEEIRAEFDRTYAGDTSPGLVRFFWAHDGTSFKAAHMLRRRRIFQR